MPRIDIEAGDLKVSAAALYAADGSGPERIDFTRLAWGWTDLAGWVVARDDGGWDANVRGASLDLEPFLEHMLDAGSRGPGRAQEAGPRFRLEAAIRRVRLGDGRHIENVAATLVNDGRRWQRVDLKARLAADGRLAITVEPEAGARRALTIRSNDAGAALRVFDFYQNMIGGTLEMTGAYDDQTSASPLAGRLLIRDYRIIKAPALARLVSILAVTGIVDVLRGEGLAFSELATRFRFQDGVLKVICGKAAGTALGVTASGRIDTRAETVQIEGTVVPAYLDQRLLGPHPGHRRAPHRRRGRRRRFRRQVPCHRPHRGSRCRGQPVDRPGTRIFAPPVRRVRRRQGEARILPGDLRGTRARTGATTRAGAVTRRGPGRGVSCRPRA